MSPRAAAVGASRAVVTFNPCADWNLPIETEVATPNTPSAPPFTSIPALISAFCNVRTFSLFWPRTGSESMVIGEPVTGAAATTGAATGADAAATVFFAVDFATGAASSPSAIAVDSSTDFVTERPYIAWNFPRAIDVAKPNLPSAPPLT